VRFHEGLQVIDTWNSANAFILYGKGEDFASCKLEDQEILMLPLTKTIARTAEMVATSVAECSWNFSPVPGIAEIAKRFADFESHSCQYVKTETP
jgi:hypothetical protein